MTTGLPNSDRLPPPGIRILSILLLLVAGSTVFLLGFHSIIEEDFWWHTKVGGDILSGSGIPRFDHYSHPSAGQPYVDLHWLFQVFIHTVHRLGGEPGVIWVKCLIGLLVFGVVYKLARRHAPRSLASMLVVLAAILSSERLLARPELGTYLLLAIFLWLLRRHEEGSRSAWLVLPLVVLLWVNIEGLFILGPIVIGAHLASRPRDQKLWASLGGSLLASLANPYFVTGALHPFVLFTRINGSLQIYSQTIGEFLGPFAPGFAHPSVSLFPIFLLLIGVALLSSARRPRVSHILLVIAFLYLAMSARRNLALLAIVATPIIASWLAAGTRRPWIRSMWNGIRPKVRTRLSAAALVLSILSLVAYDICLANGMIYNSIRTNRRFGTASAPVAFPGRAVQFLRENEVSGPIFNNLEVGGYLIHAYPEERVFIDGRLEVHSTEHFARYLQMLSGGRAWKEAEREFGFRCLIVNYASATQLTLEVLQDVTYEPVYLDDTVIVLVKNDPENESLIREHRVTRQGLREGYPSFADYDAGRLVGPRGRPPMRNPLAREVFPWSQLYLGQLFGVLMLPDLAAYQYAKAVEAVPRDVTLRFLLVDALIRGGWKDTAMRIVDETSHLPLSQTDRDVLSSKRRGIADTEVNPLHDER